MVWTITSPHFASCKTRSPCVLRGPCHHARPDTLVVPVPLLLFTIFIMVITVAESLHLCHGIVLKARYMTPYDSQQSKSHASDALKPRLRSALHHQAPLSCRIRLRSKRQIIRLRILPGMDERECNMETMQGINKVVPSSWWIVSGL